MERRALWCEVTTLGFCYRSSTNSGVIACWLEMVPQMVIHCRFQPHTPYAHSARKQPKSKSTLRPLWTHQDDRAYCANHPALERGRPVARQLHSIHSALSLGVLHAISKRSRDRGSEKQSSLEIKKERKCSVIAERGRRAISPNVGAKERRTKDVLNHTVCHPIRDPVLLAARDMYKNEIYPPK